MTDIRIAVATGAALGECPLWDPDVGKLFWIDIEGQLLHCYDPATGHDESQTLPGRPGSIARTRKPGLLLVAIESELVWFDWDTGVVSPWLVLEETDTGNRLNDGRTDPIGRFWVGSMYEDAADRRFSGQLHRVDADGSHVSTRNEIGVANGIAFDPTRGRMYFADTLCDVVWRYEYDVVSGVATDETMFADFSGLRGRPDGACVDAEGCYWVAAVYGWSVMRFTPDGVLDRLIELPVQAPTMPAFGGPNLDTLFVTSIGSAASRDLEPSPVEAGTLLALDPGVSGLVDVPFAGVG